MTLEHVTTREATLASDLSTLFKARIASFVGLSAFVGALVAPGATAGRAAEAALWITLAAAAASAFNQVLERDTDLRMHRTRNRPLPAGRITPTAAILTGSALAVLAVGMLAARFPLLAALLALGTLFAYVAVYTPLKRVSTVNTVVGAVPGAAPPLIGYVAMCGRPEGWAWALFAIVFVWQFPHFMAIAWLWREDYARAGLRMLPSARGGESIAGRTAIVHAAMLLPVSFAPAVWGEAGAVFTASAALLGLVYCAAAARFAWKQQRSTARLLLFVSLAYLPLVLLAVVLDPRTHAFAAFR